MDPNNFKDEINALLPRSLVQNPEEHPLHMLDNQADPETKPKIILQKSIRTYESDVAEALANRKISTIEMAVAENKRKFAGKAGEVSGASGTSAIASSDEPSSKKSGEKLFIVIISLVLIGVGLGGGYYLYLMSPLAVEAPTAVTDQKISSIITPDNQKIVPINNIASDQLAKKLQSLLANEKTSSQRITDFVLTKTFASTTIRVTGPEIVDVLGLQVSEAFKRSLTNNWMFGLAGNNTGKDGFIILTNNFFQNAYAGMLKWEPVMADDLSVALNYREKAITSPMNASSTASSTPTIVKSLFTIHGKFFDREISNRDVREFFDDAGDLLVLYSFLDKNTLVITTSETTLKLLIDKLEKQTYTM